MCTNVATLFLGLFSDKRLKVKQRQITSKTKSVKYLKGGDGGCGLW